MLLIAVVCAVIGTTTTPALRSHLYEQLDGQLEEVAARASGAMPSDARRNGGHGPVPPPSKKIRLTDFVTRGPQPQGTTVASVSDGSVTAATVGETGRSARRPCRSADRSRWRCRTGRSGQGRARGNTDAEMEVVRQRVRMAPQRPLSMTASDRWEGAPW